MSVSTNLEGISPTDIIRRAHAHIMRSSQWCWLSQVIMLGKWYVIKPVKFEIEIEGKKVPVSLAANHTACTDGYNTWYNEDFIMQLWTCGKSDEERDKAVRHVVLHENIHKALRHTVVWKHLWKKDPKKANVAADIIVNNETATTPEFCFNSPEMMERLGFKVPWEPNFAGLSTGQVWDKLDDNQMKKMFGDGPQDSQDGHIPVEWSPGALKEMEGKIEQAIRNGLILQQQKDPNRANRLVEALAPKVKWQKFLREWLRGRTFGRDHNNWKRPGRRSHAVKTFLPATYSRRVGKLLIGVDTSGSIQDELLSQFLGEVGALCKSLCPEEVILSYWGDHVVNTETYTPATYSSMLQSTKPKDGGGTALGCLLEQAKTLKDIRGIIILTDGYVFDGWHQGQWPADTMVILNTDVECPLTHTRI